MNKEELIGKLHMIYAGDRNALEEMVGYYDGLKQGIEIVQQENKELKEQLLVTQTNEETFRLEMKDITQTLGLDEDTIFDDVKTYARSLKENKILRENAENNDKVADKVNWENQLLKKENKQLKEEKRKVRDYINKHCVNEKIMKILGDK